MRVVTILLCALTWACCAAAEAQQAAPSAGPPPAEAYGRLPAVQDMAISPDGSRLVILVTSETQSALRIYNLASGAFESTLPAPAENKFRGVSWADDTRAVYFISRALLPHQALPYGYRFVGNPGHVEYWRVGVVDINPVRARLLMNDERGFANTNLSNLTAPIEGDPGYGRMVAYSGVGVGNLMEDQPQLTIFRVNLRIGSASPSTVGNDDTLDFAMNARGEPVARLDADNKSGRWSLVATNAGGDRVLEQGVTNAGILPALLAQMQDGAIAVYDRSDDGANDALVTFNPATGEKKEVVLDDDVHPQGVIVDPWTHLGVGVSWTEDFPHQHFFDPALQRLSDRLADLFEGSYAQIISWSADKSHILVEGERSEDAGAYYVYEAATNRLTRIALRYPDVAGPGALGERRAITYRARDGQRVPAYLTLPSGVEPRNLPLVLLVHGGPAARDTFQFDWWASFLASRGYAVLQPNFRGSIGFGHDWYAAGQGHWGDGVMQTDVEDGVVALAHSGMIDPARVCIMGGSYGGYSALIGGALTPDRYACVVSVAGVSDILDLLDRTAEASGGSRSLASDWWRVSIGDPRTQRDRLRFISPITHAQDFRAPVLLLHGEDDTVVPIEQSQHMASALRSAGKDVRLVTLQGDDHWLSEPQTRIQMLQEIDTFLDAHIGARRPATPAH